MSRRSIAILGSTGSIGTQTLDVVRQFPDLLRVEALAAGSNADLLVRQALEFKPRLVHIADVEAAQSVCRELEGTGTRVIVGHDGLCQVATEANAEVVVAATVGWTGVEPTLAAIQRGREIALANKEVLVCAGSLVTEKAQKHGVAIRPLDSEHNAIAQCLSAGPFGPRAPLRRIILTCSGGPYRTSSADEIAVAGVDRTLAHPTWTMGRKITVDSATLMNKGFEVIEAHHLFGVFYEKLEVLIHPQSIVHSIVEFVDGSMIAQMGVTDMRLPIQNVLTYPVRRPTPLAPLDLATIARLDFAPPDMDRFPCLKMAYDCGSKGGTWPCVLNAANEIAVGAHLERRIPLGDIPKVIARILDEHEAGKGETIEEFRAADAWARSAAKRALV